MYFQKKTANSEWLLTMQWVIVDYLWNNQNVSMPVLYLGLPQQEGKMCRKYEGKLILWLSELQVQNCPKHDILSLHVISSMPEPVKRAVITKLDRVLVAKDGNLVRMLLFAMFIMKTTMGLLVTTEIQYQYISKDLVIILLRKQCFWLTPLIQKRLAIFQQCTWPHTVICVAIILSTVDSSCCTLKYSDKAISYPNINIK